MRLLSMVEHACAYSMDCSVSQRIWIFPCLLQMRTLTLPNTFSLSLTNSLWWAERLKSEKGQEEFGKVESAFLKDNTDVYDITFQTEKSVKIKIEVDTQPPLKFKTEQKLLLLPQSFMTRCFTLPTLFAGKMHALVYRAWKNRVKGRDWYDFEWYVRHNVPLDFTHLCERALQFNQEELDKETFLQKLNERLVTADINQVKADVFPFVRNPKELDIWSNDYFCN